MKIALTFPGCHRRGGVERIVYECARFLANREHDVHVFAADFDRDPSAPSIVYHPIEIPSRPAFLHGPRFFKACTEAIDREKFDVLATHGSVCPTGGVHWVQSVHAAWLEQSRRRRAPLSLARLKQRVNPLHPMLLQLERRHFAQRQYLKLAVTTSQVRADLNRIFQVPLGDIEILPNGFNPDEFSPARRLEQREAMRRKLGLEPHHLTLLFVANELDRKGYGTILSALKIINDPNLRLLVVGRPPTETVMARASDAGVASQVIACGSTTNVADYHAAADAFVLPTQYEAFCLAILEALGSGLPVITSAVPGAQDAIDPHRNGLIVQDPNSGEELAQAIRRISDPAIRQSLANHAPASVAAYQWPAILQRYESLLMRYASISDNRPALSPC